MKPLTPARLKVLSRLADGDYPASIAKQMRVDKATVQHHVKALLADGLVYADTAATGMQRNALGHTRVTIYALTDRGKSLLAGEREAPHGGVAGIQLGNSQPAPRVEVHNFRARCSIKSGSIEWMPRAAELNNFLRKWDSNFHGAYLEVIEVQGQQRTAIIAVRSEAASHKEAEAECVLKVLRVCKLLEQQYGLSLSLPEIARDYGPGKAKAGVLGSPLTTGLAPQVGQLALVDRTPEPGTLHPRDPTDADRVVQLARNVEDVRTLCAAMAENQARFFQFWSEFFKSMGPAPADGSKKPAPPGPEVA